MSVQKYLSGSKPEELPGNRFQRLYIAAYDRHRGVPVAPSLRAVAGKLEAAIFRYRISELLDEAQVANLAEEAVYKANWALLGRDCTNSAAYVLTIFRRDVDEHLKRLARIVNYDDDRLVFSNVVSGVLSSENAVSRVLVREILESMDALTRWICLRRIVDGESPEEIGREIGLSANAVSIRLSRGLARAKRQFGSMNRH